MPKFIKLHTLFEGTVIPHFLNVDHIVIYCPAPLDDEGGHKAVVGHTKALSEAIHVLETVEQIDKLIRGIETGDNKA